MSVQANGVTIECVTGDITKQDDLDAVVNAANAELMPGGGVAGAIHRVAGKGLAEECRPLAPIEPGQAVSTGAHAMPNKRLIHCLGPVYGRDKPEAELLAACYRNALRLAEQAELASVGFPAISTGAFGYPRADAAEVAMRACQEETTNLERVRLVRFVLFGDDDRKVHEKALEKVVCESAFRGRNADL